VSDTFPDADLTWKQTTIIRSATASSIGEFVGRNWLLGNQFRPTNG
jgi:hypothetical protein